MEVILIKNKFLLLNFLLIYLSNGLLDLKIRFDLQFLFDFKVYTFDKFTLYYLFVLANYFIVCLL